MNQIILGAMAGWFAGGLGFIIAGKFHGEEKGQTWYPAYAAVLFCAVIMAAQYFL